MCEYTYTLYKCLLVYIYKCVEPKLRCLSAYAFPCYFASKSDIASSLALSAMSMYGFMA